MGFHRQHLTLACFLPTHSNPKERLTKGCQALYPTACTTYAQGPEVGPTASNHLQATVAESSRLLAEEWRVESGQGGIALPRVVVHRGVFSCLRQAPCQQPSWLFKSKSSLSLTLSFPLLLHLVASDSGATRAVDQSPTLVSIHLHLVTRSTSSVCYSPEEPCCGMQGDNEDTAPPSRAQDDHTLGSPTAFSI